jgi:murein DD-endopeptidase MepM/ murein hydrolase activator NlpD
MKNLSQIQVRLGLFIVILIICTACQPVMATPFIPSISTPIPNTPTIMHNLSLPIVSNPEPTLENPVYIELDSQPPEPNVEPVYVELDSQSPEPIAETVQIEYPTSKSATISTWRPALYPVPLALTPFDHFYFSRPFAVNEIGWPVEDYRYGGSFFEDVVHKGMDIKIPDGTPILAAGPGRVVWAGYGLFSGKYDPDDPYGQAVMIRHNFGFQGTRLYTVYAHLDRVDVQQDQYIDAGRLLGLSGQTGKTSGPHLHFEVRLNQDGFFSTLNPELWLVPPQGWGVLAGRVMNTGGRKVEGQMVIVRTDQSEQWWRANSYHRGYVNSDPYYQENLVISDLPAGRYEIVINYLSRIYTQEIDIYPGLVSYFSFRGRNGFTSEPPPFPGSDFNPPQSP